MPFPKIAKRLQSVVWGGVCRGFYVVRFREGRIKGKLLEGFLNGVRLVCEYFYVCVVLLFEGREPRVRSLTQP